MDITILVSLMRAEAVNLTGVREQLASCCFRLLACTYDAGIEMAAAAAKPGKNALKSLISLDSQVQLLAVSVTVCVNIECNFYGASQAYTLHIGPYPEGGGRTGRTTPPQLGKGPLFQAANTAFTSKLSGGSPQFLWRVFIGPRFKSNDPTPSRSELGTGLKFIRFSFLHRFRIKNDNCCVPDQMIQSPRPVFLSLTLATARLSHIVHNMSASQLLLGRVSIVHLILVT